MSVGNDFDEGAMSTLCRRSRNEVSNARDDAAALANDFSDIVWGYANFIKIAISVAMFFDMNCFRFVDDELNDFFDERREVQAGSVCSAAGASVVASSSATGSDSETGAGSGAAGACAAAACGAGGSTTTDFLEIAAVRLSRNL